MALYLTGNHWAMEEADKRSNYTKGYRNTMILRSHELRQHK